MRLPVTASRSSTVRGLLPAAASRMVPTAEPEARVMAALIVMSRPDRSSTRSSVAAAPLTSSGASARRDSPDSTTSTGAV